MALSCKRTAVKFGYHHYCKVHNQLVDAKHIDVCVCIKPSTGKVTSTITPLEGLKNMWDIEGGKLKEMQALLTKFKDKIIRLCKNGQYTVV
jgi:hypothetical protein